MSNTKRWSKMTWVAVLAILLCIFVGAGAADPVQVTITGSNWVKAGTGTTLHVEGLETAPAWYYQLYDMTTREVIDYVSSNDGGAMPGDVSYDASKLQADHQYQFEVWSSPEYSRFYFYVYNETDSNISIDINEDPDGVLVNKYYDLQITAPGASLFAWRDLNQADYWNYCEVTNTKTGKYETDTDWDEGPHTIIAKAYYGEVDDDNFPGYDSVEWGPVCAVPKHFDTVSYGPAPIPTLHVEQDSYTRGEYVTVSAEADLTKIDYIELDVRRTDSQDAYSCTHWERGEEFTGELVFTTARMPAGEYMLDVRTKGAGYENNQTYLTQETFTVTEAPEGSVVFRVSTDEVLAYDDFTFSCYAPGASSVTIYQSYSYRDEEVWPNYSSATYAGGSRQMWTDDVILYAVAIRYDSEGKEIRTKTEPITIHSVVNGKIDADFSIPMAIQKGQEATITFSGMEKIDRSWNFSVYDETTYEQIMYRFISGRAEKPESITISTEDLQTDHIYQVSVSGNGRGYNSYSQERRFYVYEGEPDTNIAFAIDGEPAPDEIYINKEYKMTISAEGATAIAWLNDYYSSWQYEILDANQNSIQEEIRVGDKGKYSIIAKACYEPISGNPNYDEINWGAPGAAMLNCNVISKGPAKMILSEIPTTNLAGKDVTVHWTPQYENQCVTRRLVCPGISMSWGEDEYIERDMLFDGYRMDTPGKYKMVFESSADGYENYMEEYEITVVENDQRPAVPTSFIKNAKIYAGISFEVCFEEIQEAVHIEIHKPEPNGTYTHVTNGGNRNVDSLRFNVNEAGTYDIFMYVSEDGVWSEWTKALTFTAEEIPNVSELTLDIPKQASIGEEFSFVAFAPANGQVMLTIEDAEGKIVYENSNYAYDSWKYAYCTVQESQLINSKAIPGTAVVTAIFKPEDGTDEEVKTATLTIAGEQPEKPTLTYESMIAEAGTPLRVSGTAGSAEKIKLNYSVENKGRSKNYSQMVNITDGKWAAEIPTNESGMYSVTVSGSKGGLFTGSASADLFVTGEDSLPAPTIEVAVDPNNQTKANMHFKSPDDKNEVRWQYWWTTEDGKTISSGYTWGDAGEDLYDDYYFSFKNTYALTVVYSINDTWSAPATGTITVTGGRPWPVNGPLPIDVEVPQTWKAGQDLLIHWAPSVEGQRMSISVYNMANGKYAFIKQSSLSIEGDFTVFGYSLEPGNYSVRFNSELDTWEDTSKEYRMTVTANDQRPEAPTATTGSATIYENVPFKISLDKQWEAVAVEVWKAGETYYQNRNILEMTDNISTSVSSTGTYDLYISGSIDHTWSEMKKAGTITVEPIPTVSEITLLMPEQITIGEDLPVTVFLPEEESSVNIRVLNTNGSVLVDYGSFWASYRYANRTFLAEDLVNNGITPGTILVDIISRPDGSETTEKKTGTIKVVGESFERPTIKANSVTGEAGTPIRISGSTGSADQIQISYDVQTTGNTYTYSSQSDISGDSWTADIATPMSGNYRIRVKGYKGSLCTGSAYMEMIVTGEDSLPAPMIEATADPENQTKAHFLFKAPDDENEVYWRYWWTTEDGEPISSNTAWADAGEDYQSNIYFNYKNTYVLTAVYRIYDVWSAPSKATVTITAGKPWPIYGKLPIEVEVPQTWPAGKDMTIHWAPTVEGQRTWVDVYDERSNWISTKVSSLKAEGDFYILGGSLEPGNYRFVFGSELDYWENTYKTYTVTVTENAQRPDAPEATVKEGTCYAGVPFNVQFAEEQESVLVELWTTGEYPNRYSSTSGTFTDNITLSTGTAGVYDVYVTASVNNVWSVKGKIGQINVQEIPAVTKITLIAPDEMAIGEKLQVTALLPGGIERIGLRLLKANGAVLYDYGSRWNSTSSKYTSWDIDADELLNCNIEPGTMTLEVRPYSADYEPGEAITQTITVTGTVPERPTMENIPKTIEKGTPITLRGTVGSADRIKVTYDVESGSGNNNYSILPAITDGIWTAEIPTPAEGRYSITAKGYKGGLCTGSISEVVHVTGEKSLKAPTISAGPEYPGSSYIRMKCTAPESETMVHWHYWWAHESGGIVVENNVWTSPGSDLSTGVGFNYSGKYTLTVTYGIGSIWSAPATTEVTLTNGRPWPVNGPLPIELEVPESWPAGQDLTLHWVPAVSGQTLRMSVYDPETDRFLRMENSRLTEEGDLVLSGATMEPGSYVLRVYSQLDTWEDTEEQYTLTVVKNDNRPETGAVTISPDTLTTLTEITAQTDKMYDGIAALVNDRSMVFARETNRLYIDNGIKVGENKLAIQTCTDGIWSIPKIMTITVTEAETLGKPRITIDSTIQIGKTATVKIACDENTKRIEVSAASMDEDCYYNRVIYLAENEVTLTLPEDAFAPGAGLIEVHAYANGYYSSSATAEYTVTGQRPDAPTVSFNRTEGEAGDTVYATILTNNAVEMKKLYGWDEETYYSPINGKCKIPVELDFYGETEYQFRTKVNGIWSKWTDRYVLTTTTEVPEIKEPAGGFVIFPETIEPGKDVEVTFRKAEGAEVYSLDLQTYTDVGGFEGYLYGASLEEPGTITIPAEYFYNGGNIGFSAQAGLKYYLSGPNPYLWQSKEYTVQPIDDSSWAALAITVDKNEALIDEPITVKLQNTQAEEIIVNEVFANGCESNYGTYSNWEGGTLSEFTVSYYKAGTFNFKVRAKVNGKWTKETEIYSVRINEFAKDALSNPMITDMPARVTKGKPITVKWEAIEGAEYYHVFWHMINGNWHSARIQQGTSYTIRAEDLAQPGVYMVYVQSGADDRPTNEDVYNSIVTVGDYSGDTLTLPSALTEIESEGLAGTKAEVIIVPESCTKIGSKAFANSKSLSVVMFLGTDTAIAADAFEGCDYVTVIAPEGSKTAQNLIDIGITPEYD